MKLFDGSTCYEKTQLIAHGYDISRSVVKKVGRCTFGVGDTDVEVAVTILQMKRMT